MSAVAPGRADLKAWLEWQTQLHARPIELGLARVGDVAHALGLLPFPVPAVVIAGTNGKGSCAALLAQLLGANAAVGVYTSPHLWRYNERVRIASKPVGDTALCEAFAAVEAARGATPLTYFEFGTLAALWLFARARLDYAVLEVGLGGRLDAVNIVDADVALITNIGLDHTDWLGDDREAIGAEKAGIMRGGAPAVCADRAMPASIDAVAATTGAELAVIGRDFDITPDNGAWRWRGAEACLRFSLPAQAVADNIAATLQVAHCLGLAPGRADIERAAAARPPGRREVVAGAVEVVYDVGHNAEAIGLLVEHLAAAPPAGATHVVLGMLADKPVAAVAARLRAVADRFYAAGLEALAARGLDGPALAARLGAGAAAFAEPAAALAAARRAASAGDRIVVCGSFVTVANARE